MKLGGHKRIQCGEDGYMREAKRKRTHSLITPYTIKVKENREVERKEPGELEVNKENTKIQKREREKEIQGAGGEEKLKDGEQDPELARKHMRNPKTLKARPKHQNSIKLPGG